MWAAMFSAFANPHRFMAFSGPLAIGLATLAIVLLPWGLWQAFFLAPPERDQGEMVRVMFVHVPSAWLAMFIYAMMGAASFVYFVWRHALADVAAKAAAPVGAAFAFLTLATGSIWGRPDWGAWWAWDARLASMLILFLLYLGYIALRAALDDERQASRAAAILCMVGLANLPIVKFSVDWWETLHQPASVFRFDGPTMGAAYLIPLGVMALAFTFGFGALLLLRMRTEILNRRAEALDRALEAAQ